MAAVMFYLSMAAVCVAIGMMIGYCIGKEEKDEEESQRRIKVVPKEPEDL